MLSIITVTWNNEKTIADQIRSVILACEGLEFELIILDNNSTDNTKEIIHNIWKNNEGLINCSGATYKLYLIENKKNIGFARANNLGVNNSKGEYVLFLNPDMKLEKGIIKELLDYLKFHVDVGIISPKLVKENGEFSFGDGPRRFPKFFYVVMIFFKISKLFPKILNRYYYSGLDKESIQEVDSVRGAFMLIKKDYLEKIGLWDTRYFCWFEDVDLCRKIKKIGKKVIYYSKVKAIDMVGQSFKQRNIFWKQWTFFISAFKYFKKWGIKN